MFFTPHIGLKKVLLLIGLLAITAVQGGPLTLDPQLRTGKLSNGLTYYIYPNQNPKGNAIYRLYIKSGSVLEENKQKGLAHFIEHMAFNGTLHFPNDSIIKYLQKNGAKFGRDINAHTSMNETVYKLSLSSKDPQLVDNTLTILADWAGGLLFDSLQVEKERGVILSERLSKEGKSRDAQRIFLTDLLNGSRYSKRETIGDPAIIRNAPREELIKYYQKWYNPSLMAISVIGDINPDEIENQIRKKFSSIKAHPINQDIDYSIDNFKKEKMLVAENKGSNKISVSITQLMDKSEPINTEEGYFNFLQKQILNRLAKQRFSSLSMEKLTYSKASWSASSFLNVKEALFASVQLPGHNTREAMYAFSRDLEQIYRFGFTHQEIERVKKAYLEEKRRQAESKTTKTSTSLTDETYELFYRGSAIITRKEESRLANQYAPLIDSLSIVQLLHELYKPKQTHYMLTTYDLKNKNINVQKIFHQVRKENRPRYNKNIAVPKQLLSQEIAGGSIVHEENIPAIQAQLLELSNGVKVVFKRIKSNSDKITLSGFRSKGLYSLDSTLYLSGQYAGGLIAASGTQRLNRDQLSMLLTGSSASVRMLIDKNRCGVVATANPEDLETMFQLLYLRWTEPTIDSTTYSLYKEKTIEALTVERKTPQKEFEEKMVELSSGKSYVNQPVTPWRIRDELKIENMLPIYNYCYGDPSGYIFSLIGECSLEEVKPFIEKYLGGIPAIETPIKESLSSYMGPQIPRKDSRYSIKVNGSPKASTLILIQQDTLYCDFSKFKLLCDLTQGVLREKLMKTLREEMGKIYSISVGCSSTPFPQPLAKQSISFACSPEDVDLLSDTIFDQLKKLSSQPNSFQTELENTKKNLIKDWDTDKKTSSFWSGAIRNHYYYNQENWQEVTHYDQLIQNITPNDVSRFIEQTLLKSPHIRGVILPATSQK